MFVDLYVIMRCDAKTRQNVIFNNIKFDIYISTFYEGPASSLQIAHYIFEMYHQYFTKPATTCILNNWSLEITKP